MILSSCITALVHLWFSSSSYYGAYEGRYLHNELN